MTTIAPTRRQPTIDRESLRRDVMHAEWDASDAWHWLATIAGRDADAEGRRARGAATVDDGRDLIRTAFLLVYECTRIWPDAMPEWAPTVEDMYPLLESILDPHDPIDPTCRCAQFCADPGS